MERFEQDRTWLMLGMGIRYVSLSVARWFVANVLPVLLFF